MTADPQPAAPTRRLFFACWPDPATRATLVGAIQGVVPAGGGQPVAPSRLHVTLLFLGAVRSVDLPAVMAAAAGLAVAPFEFLFDDLEYWPKPQVLVAVPSSPPVAAARLADALGARLALAGRPVERRPWRPHVTLARTVTRPPAAGSALAPVRWPVTWLSLVESLADRAGVRYVVLRRWPLATPGSPPDPPGRADCSPG